MNTDQVCETAISLVNEFTKTQTYLLSGVCPSQAEPVLVANQSILLANLKEHLEQSLELCDSPSIKTEEHAIKDLSKSISAVDKSIKKLKVLLTDNILPDFDLMVQSELDSMYMVRDELMDVQAAIL